MNTSFTFFFRHLYSLSFLSLNYFFCTDVFPEPMFQPVYRPCSRLGVMRKRSLKQDIQEKRLEEMIRVLVDQDRNIRNVVGGDNQKII